ncbi:NAD(P)/FAD-dependent oxidoreductase [Rhodococcus sp. 24CO]|uniref:NAD(P)/FAD-dependent oxidoreductase n=1 Tax=Rhodococcus sp. 24CO TaxID=3117460 RepID=UPI003D35851A
MSTSDRHIVIVGDSIAGCTAARELRARGHLGPITMIGADSDGSYARPPLSKHILKEGAKEAEVWDLSDLDITAIRGTATGLDTDLQAVLLTDGRQVRFDALIVATGARARRIGAPTQHGELVLRTFADARELGTRLDAADSAIVVGAGFLGMEVASVCAARGIAVTVVDVDAPLQRILGSFLSGAITARARSSPVQIVRTDRPVELIGDPVTGIALSDRELHADLVVTCAGEIPDSHWLESSGAADTQGVGIDAGARPQYRMSSLPETSPIFVARCHSAGNRSGRTQSPRGKSQPLRHWVSNPHALRPTTTSGPKSWDCRSKWSAHSPSWVSRPFSTAP